MHFWGPPMANRQIPIPKRQRQRLVRGHGYCWPQNFISFHIFLKREFINIPGRRRCAKKRLSLAGHSSMYLRLRPSTLFYSPIGWAGYLSPCTGKPVLVQVSPPHCDGVRELATDRNPRSFSMCECQMPTNWNFFNCRGVVLSSPLGFGISCQLVSTADGLHLPSSGSPALQARHLFQQQHIYTYVRCRHTKLVKCFSKQQAFHW